MKIAVASRSFSKNTALRTELESRFISENAPTIVYNDAGLSLSGEALVAFLAGMDHAVIALERIDEELLARSPDLRVIGKYGVGLNNIDLEACARHGVKIGWTPGVNRISVAEMTISLMIAAQRRMFESNRRILDGAWGQLSGKQLSASTVGLIGFGNVGQTVAKLLESFGATVLIHDILDFARSESLGSARQVSLQTLITESDVVSLHVPSTSDTRRMVNASFFAQMKRTAILVNTARGDIVEQLALKEALETGQIAGAAIDVFEEEPPSDLEFLRLKNLIATSHMGGSSDEAILAMGKAAIDGLFDAKLATRFMSH